MSSIRQGHLLFLRETTLMAQPFDARRLALTGDAFPIAEQIQTFKALRRSVSSQRQRMGCWRIKREAAAAGSQLVWFDRTGKQIGVLGDPAALQRPGAFSRRKAGFRQHSRQAGKGRDIWLYDVARGLRTRFTFDPADAADVDLVTRRQPGRFQLTPQGAFGPVSEGLQRGRH